MADAVWRGAEASAQIGQAAAQGLNRAVEALLTDSRERVPSDSRDLGLSGNVVQATPTDLEAGVTYNSPGNYDYGIRVHEDLSLHIKTDVNPNAESKFLERALIENEQKYQGIIAAPVRRVF